jgi:hypothetical protein
MVPLLQLLNVILKMNDALHLHRQVNINMNSAIHKSSYNNLSSINVELADAYAFKID